MARDFGIAIIPWSPLANGFLTGKYNKATVGIDGTGRLEVFNGMPGTHAVADNDWSVLDTLREVAEELGRTPAQVALNWVAHRPEITSTLIGATTVEQLEANLGSLDLEIPSELLTRLNDIGQPPVQHPYGFFTREHIEQVSNRDFSVGRAPRRDTSLGVRSTHQME